MTLLPKWLKTKVVPKGETVSLEKGNQYQLGEGSWSVGGDNTVYPGNKGFFVKISGDYTFTQVQ